MQLEDAAVHGFHCLARALGHARNAIHYGDCTRRTENWQERSRREAETGNKQYIKE